MTSPTEATNRCTPIAEWPAVDRQAWENALQPADLLEPTIGYASRWRPATRLMIERGYGRWLGWVARSRVLDPTEAPGDRATRERVAAYLRMLQDSNLAPYTIAGLLQSLANMLKAISPDQDWTWIQRGSSRIHASAIPTRDRRACLRPAEDLSILGTNLMRPAETDRFCAPRDRATLFRDGLLLAFLASRPLRMANLAGIQIGGQLQRRGGSWYLAFDPIETKEAQPINFIWPEALAEALESYINVHRIALLESSRKKLPPSHALWISKQGTQMTTSAIAFQIKDRTRTEFGRPINPHSFRHLAATTKADAEPENITDLQSMLGHSSMRSSEKFYNQSKMLDSGLRYQATIEDIRKRGSRQPTDKHGTGGSQ